MARLPVPGEDNDIWGQLLNEFLLVSHKADGHIQNKFDAVADIREFGAIKGSEFDNSDALEAAILSGRTVRIPTGDWRIASSKSFVLSDNVKIIGEAGGRLQFDSAVFTFSGEEVVKTAVSTTAKRGESWVSLNNVANIRPFDIIAFANNTVAELGWGYKKRSTTMVLNVNVFENTVLLAHPLNFDFFPDELNNDVTVYRSDFRLTIDNVILHALSIENSNRVLLNLVGLKNITLRNIVQENNGLGTYTVHFIRCMDSLVDNTLIYTGVYPYLVNESRNITFNALKAYDAHHVVVPATWTDTIHVNNMITRGCAGGVESHPAFNIHYSDVDVIDIDGYSNLRCIGGSIRNATIRHSGQSTSGPYFHNVSLVNSEIYDEYDFVVDGLTYDQDGKAFGPSFGRKFVIKNSLLKGGIVIGGPNAVRQAYIENCIYESFYTRALPKLDTNNNTQSFKLTDNLYTLNLLEGKVSYTNNQIKSEGVIFVERTEEPAVATVRVYDNWQQQGLSFVFGILKIKAIVRHQNMGGMDVLEQHYQFMHKLAATSAFELPFTPSYVSSSTGQINETLTMMVSDLAHQGASQQVNPLEYHFQFNITLVSGRTNPIYSLYYALELFRG